MKYKDIADKEFRKEIDDIIRQIKGGIMNEKGLRKMIKEKEKKIVVLEKELIWQIKQLKLVRTNPTKFLAQAKKYKKKKKIKDKLTRIYNGKEILCMECGTKKFQSFGNKEYGVIAIHKKNCPYFKRLWNRPSL